MGTSVLSWTRRVGVGDSRRIAVESPIPSRQPPGESSTTLSSGGVELDGDSIGSSAGGVSGRTTASVVESAPAGRFDSYEQRSEVPCPIKAGRVVRLELVVSARSDASSEPKRPHPMFRVESISSVGNGRRNGHPTGTVSALGWSIRSRLHSKEGSVR